MAQLCLPPVENIKNSQCPLPDEIVCSAKYAGVPIGDQCCFAPKYEFTKQVVFLLLIKYFRTACLGPRICELRVFKDGSSVTVDDLNLINKTFDVLC